MRDVRNVERIPFASAADLARAVATAWIDEIAAANRDRQPHCVALSGGRIAHTLFAAVAEQAAQRLISFDSVHFFWADERCVPPADPESNFAVAKELLFDPLKVREANIHRIRGEDPPDTAAKAAAAEIRKIVPLNDHWQPELDLVFLGLGEDGHIASLFPGEKDEVAGSPDVYRVIRNSPKPPPTRITLGYSAIAAARQIWMLASGRGKDAALRESLSAAGQTPFAHLLRLREGVRIFTDIQIG